MNLPHALDGMNHTFRDEPWDEEIPLENVGNKDGSTYVHIKEETNNAGSPSYSNLSQETLTNRERGQWDSKGKRKTEKKEIQREEPKVVLKRNRAVAFGHFLFFHAIPLGVALALIVLNIKTRIYGTDGSWISAIPFAAKVHELLMQASIVTVMIAYLQHVVTQKGPVPFGAIFSAYQVTQMSYLTSPEFRATLTAADWPALMKIPFVLFVSFNILLAAAVGPSSTVAMQPRQVNYTLPNDRLALNITTDLLYPTSLTKAGPPLDFQNPGWNELSPAAGWESLQRLPSTGGTGDQTTEAGLQQVEVVVSKDTGRYKEVMPELYSTQLATAAPGYDMGSSVVGAVTRTMYIQYAPNGTFATTQHIPIALALSRAGDDFTQYLNGDGSVVANIEMPQAYSSVFCQLNTIKDENDTRPIQFPDTYVAGCGSELQCESQGQLNNAGLTNYTAITRKEIWDQAKKDQRGRIIWVDGIKIQTPIPGNALGAIVVHPDFCATNSTTPFLSTSACVVGARWANTTSHLSYIYNGLFISNNPTAENNLNSTSLMSGPNWGEESITMSKAWADTLNPETDVQNRTVADNLLRAMPISDNICPPGGSYPNNTQPYYVSFPSSRPFMHEQIVSALVANGLSHVAGAVELWVWYTSKSYPGHGWEYTNSSAYDYKQTIQRNPPGVVLTFSGRLPGYAWSLNGIPIKFAIPILCLYVAYITIYVLYTFVTGSSSMAWRSISGLVALAMGSQPSKLLKHTSAGINITETFRNKVGVREVVGDKRLELVFAEDERRDSGDGTYPRYRNVKVGRGY